MLIVKAARSKLRPLCSDSRKSMPNRQVNTDYTADEVRKAFKATGLKSGRNVYYIRNI